MKKSLFVFVFILFQVLFLACKNEGVGPDCPPQVDYISSALLSQNIKTYVNAYYGTYKLNSSEKKTYCDNYVEYYVYVSNDTSNKILVFDVNGNFIKTV